MWRPRSASISVPSATASVRIDRRTGRKSLFLSAHAGALVGWSIPEATAIHRWRLGDLVARDARTTMHRARRFHRGELRDVRRTTLVGDASDSTGHLAGAYERR